MLVPSSGAESHSYPNYDYHLTFPGDGHILQDFDCAEAQMIRDTCEDF